MTTRYQSNPWAFDRRGYLLSQFKVAVLQLPNVDIQLVDLLFALYPCTIGCKEGFSNKSSQCLHHLTHHTRRHLPLHDMIHWYRKREPVPHQNIRLHFILVPGYTNPYLCSAIKFFNPCLELIGLSRLKQMNTNKTNRAQLEDMGNKTGLGASSYGLFFGELRDLDGQNIPTKPAGTIEHKGVIWGAKPLVACDVLETKAEEY
jgi:hypothetical protein